MNRISFDEGDEAIINAYNQRTTSTGSNGRSNSIGSRNNSIGGAEFFLPITIEAAAREEMLEEEKAKDSNMLIVSFFSMILIGLMNKIFGKLQTIPMHNYPNFLNLLTTFVYVPVCFAYIIPMARSGYIPKEQVTLNITKKAKILFLIFFVVSLFFFVVKHQG